jgi:hypothetical protein
MNTVNLTASSRDVSAVVVQVLPRDMRRMLRVQWKEFIHYLEDYQVGVKVHELSDESLDNDSRNAA